MAEKLVIEFYEGDAHKPIAVILVRDFGEDPIAAAMTVEGFIESVKDATDSAPLCASDLVTRFVLWEASLSGCSVASRLMGTSFLAYAPSYLYQLVRLRATAGALHVEIVPDQYSLESELEEASALFADALHHE